MIGLRWSNGSNVSSCEHGHFCAWVERLSWDGRFAWTVDTPGGEDPEEIVNLDSGVAADLPAARLAVAEAMTRLGASERGSWQAREDAIVMMFPVMRPDSPEE
jgi:hypothetical protein